MRPTLILASLLVPALLAPARAQVHERTLDPPAAATGGGFSDRVAVSGHLGAVCMPTGFLPGADAAGLVLVHDLATGARLQTLELALPEHGFARDVAMSGERVLVARYGLAGKAFVIDAVSGATLHTLTAPDGTEGFGASLAMDGDLVAVNAVGSHEHEIPGKVFVFDLAQGSDVTIDAPAGLPDLSYYGSDLDLDGDLLAVATGTQGRVDLYDAPTGTLLRTFSGLPVSNGVFSRGLMVDLDDGVLAVGSYRAQVGASESAGRVWLYDVDTGAELHDLTAPTVDAYGLFGYDVSLSGGRLYVGEPLDGGLTSTLGALHVYDVGTGELLTTLTPPAALGAPPADRPSLFGGASASALPGAPSVPEGGGASGLNLGQSVAAGDEYLLVGSLPDAAPYADVGQAHVYSLTAPRMRVLSVGISDDGVIIPSRWDLAAGNVADAFQDGFDLPDEDVEHVPLSYDDENEFDGIDNKALIKARIDEWSTRVRPGDTFVFYLGTHGAFEETGDELTVCAQVRVGVAIPLIGPLCIDTSGDEALFTGADATPLYDDELREWFSGPAWDEVNKLFLLDGCMSGGFWGTTVLGDSGDLATLPRSALIASAPEERFSYTDQLTGLSYHSTAIVRGVGDLAQTVATLGLDSVGFGALSAAVADHSVLMLDEFAAATGDFEGLVAGSGPYDLSEWYEQVVEAELRPFAASTPDFVLVGDSDAADPRTLRVPKDVLDLQQAVWMAQPGDTILVKGGTWHGPLAIEGKQGLTLKARGTKLVGGGLHVSDAAGVVVEGLTVLDAKGPAVAVSGSSDVQIRRVRVLGGEGPGVEVTASELVQLERLKIVDVAGDGIVLGRADGDEVHSSSVARCKLLDVGGEGLTLSGDLNSVCRNRLRDIGGDGLTVPVAGMGNTFERNALKGVGADGFYLAGSSQAVVRNRVTQAEGVGLALTGDGGHLVERNACTRGAGDGVEITSPANALTKNRSLANEGAGYRLTGSGTSNTLTANKAARNDGGPLADDAGGNTYDGNSFDGP